MMNKRYIDFVPVDRKSVPKAKPVSTKVSARNGAPKRVVAKEKIVRKEVEEIPLEEMFEEKPRPAGVSTGLAETKFGVIEDYRPMFVKTDVKKRPLGAKDDVKSTTTLAKTMPVKTISRNVDSAKVALTRSASVKSASVNPTSVGSAPTKSVLMGSAPVRSASVNPTSARPKLDRPFKANFINTNKIEKRPLSSRGVYTKKTVSDMEIEKSIEQSRKSEKPVRIIAKPEKDSNVGMIIAVILTIILGAAAGTVAFLLLPK